MVEIQLGEYVRGIAFPAPQAEIIHQIPETEKNECSIGILNRHPHHKLPWIVNKLGLDAWPRIFVSEHTPTAVSHTPQ